MIRLEGLLLMLVKRIQILRQFHIFVLWVFHSYVSIAFETIGVRSVSSAFSPRNYLGLITASCIECSTQRSSLTAIILLILKLAFMVQGFQIVLTLLT